MMEDIEASLVGSDYFELIASGNLAEAEQIMRRQRQQGVLHKALYMFVDIFVSVLLHDALGRPVPRNPSSGISLSQVLREGLMPLPLPAILPAYCVVIYRNVLIAHQDHQRRGAHTWSPERVYRFWPQSADVVFTEADTLALNRLCATYAPTFPQLVIERSPYHQLMILFNNIPIADEQNRREVNRMVERLGCPSMTRQEILAALDQFALEVVRATPARLADHPEAH